MTGSELGVVVVALRGAAAGLTGEEMDALHEHLVNTTTAEPFTSPSRLIADLDAAIAQVIASRTPAA